MLVVEVHSSGHKATPHRGVLAGFVRGRVALQRPGVRLAARPHCSRSAAQWATSRGFRIPETGSTRPGRGSDTPPATARSYPQECLDLVDEFRVWHFPTMQWIQGDLVGSLNDAVGRTEERFPSITSRLKTSPRSSANSPDHRQRSVVCRTSPAHGSSSLISRCRTRRPRPYGSPRGGRVQGV